MFTLLGTGSIPTHVLGGLAIIAHPLFSSFGTIAMSGLGISGLGQGGDGLQGLHKGSLSGINRSDGTLHSCRIFLRDLKTRTIEFPITETAPQLGQPGESTSRSKAGNTWLFRGDDNSKVMALGLQG